MTISTNRNRKWLIVAWSIYVLTFILQIILLARYEDQKQIDFVWTNVVGSYIAGSVLILLYIIPLNKLISGLSIPKKILILFFAGFIFSVLFIGLVTFIQSLLQQKFDYTLYREEVIYYLKYHFHNIFKNYIFLTILLFALEYFQRENSLIKHENALKTSLVNAQLENLRSQFQPHFLFNALNSVVAVIDENKDKAQNMLIQLSDILRISIDNNFKCEHSLLEEINFLQKYLNIEKIRFEEQLEYSFEIDPEFKALNVPCLILQPMVENAIKHGFKRQKGTLKIVIKTNTHNNTLSVSNNGANLKDAKFGKGLEGIQKRLQILYEGRSGFSIYQNDGWVVNELKLPC